MSTTDDDDTSAMVTDLAAANEEARGSTLSSVISGCRCSGDPTRRRAGDRMSAAVADPRDSRGGSAELHRSLANWTVADAMIHAPKVCGLATSLAQLHELFRDDHIHAALIVEHGALQAVVERTDLDPRAPLDSPAHAVGYLTGRVTPPDADLAATWETMRAFGRRRLAVIDRDRRLLGLLCLKRNERGFCADTDVRARSEESSSNSQLRIVKEKRQGNDDNVPTRER